MTAREARLEAAIRTSGSDDDVVVLYKRVPPARLVNGDGMAGAGMSEDVREPPDRRLIEREASATLTYAYVRASLPCTKGPEDRASPLSYTGALLYKRRLLHSLRDTQFR